MNLLIGFLVIFTKRAELGSTLGRHYVSDAMYRITCRLRSLLLDSRGENETEWPCGYIRFHDDETPYFEVHVGEGSFHDGKLTVDDDGNFIADVDDFIGYSHGVHNNLNPSP